jgi:hypothetical protein
MLGILFAVQSRRTVTTWIQASHLFCDFRNVFYHLPQIGQNNDNLLHQFLTDLIQSHRDYFTDTIRIRLVVDDTTTKHYGKKIEGCGWHHNATPGGTDSTLCWGHSWVVVGLVLTHPTRGEILLPIGSSLYVQKRYIELLGEKYEINFKTKCELVVELITEILPYFKEFDKRIEIICDGGYAKSSVIVPLLKLEGVCVITRLRRDARVFELPPKPTGKRGRPPVKGKQINMSGKATCNRGWNMVECFIYGKTNHKQYKTFIGVSELSQWQPVRIVLVKEEDGTWVPLMSTNIELSVQEIIESYGVRFGIEEVFKDLKDNYGWGKQEVRNLLSSIGVTVMNMLVYNITELCCWDIPSRDIVDRRFRPWDDADRRPSHRDKRKYLKLQLLQKELNALLQSKQNTKKIFEKLMPLFMAT